MSGPFRPFVAVLCFTLSVGFAAAPLFVSDFSGFDPDQFPVRQDSPPVLPAGYTFGIWGLLYGWLILGSGWGLVNALRDGAWHVMRLPLSVSLAMGTAWLAVAVAHPVGATVLIWAMLISALAALIMSPNRDRVWAAYPVGLYAGWLSGAACVSLGVLIGGYGFLDPTTAAVVMVACAAGLGGFVQAVLARAPTYGLGVIWALSGIAVANWEGPAMAVAYVALLGAALVAIPTLMSLPRG